MEKAVENTLKKRPDLLEKIRLSAEYQNILEELRRKRK